MKEHPLSWKLKFHLRRRKKKTNITLISLFRELSIAFQILTNGSSGVTGAVTKASSGLVYGIRCENCANLNCCLSAAVLMRERDG